jgi:signal transduction histidine kinase
MTNSKKALTLFLNVLLAGIYFYSAKFGLSLAFVNESATAVWPPTGIALAAAIFFGTRMWPGILIGAFLINYTVDQSLFVASVIAIGNTLEAIVGASLVHRFVKGKLSFGTSLETIRFIFFGALVSPLISASIGTTGLCLGHLAAWNDFPAIWLTWWLGDMVSALVITPFLLVGAEKSGRSIFFKRPIEALSLVAAIFLISEINFGPFALSIFENNSLEYLCLPFLIWAAYRFRQMGAVTSVFLMSAIAINGTLQGSGPFALSGHPHESLLLLQMFLGVASIVALVLASLVAESVRHAEQLTHSNQELEQFTYVISHDLQEPIRKIINYSDRLGQKASALGASEKDYLDRMQKAAHRMKMVIEDLLQFSRASKKAPYENVDLNEVVKEVILDLELKIHETDARIEANNLPSVRANKIQMKHLFQNLITNAIKFSKKNQRPQIKIDGRVLPSQFVELDFIDNGIGFEEKYAKKIFLPFQQLHARGEYEGSGIGLSIVKKILENHEGAIRVKSTPGQGTTFTVTLPQR